jgi:molybdopterin-guanine dinucleotide biosynthesis protein A
MRSAIILVGGEARRAGGVEKYFFQYRGRFFIDCILEALWGLVEELVIVAKDPDQCARFRRFRHMKVVPDIRKGIGPIGGLHAGVLSAAGDELFVSACDMPFINAGVVSELFRLLEDYEAVIPCWDREKLEPLHAVYRKEALLRYLEDHETLSLRRMVRELNTRYVPVEHFRKFDPALRTFVNVNRLDELEAINGDLAGGS